MPFIARPIPQTSESLNSLLMRTAEANGLSTINHVLHGIGINQLTYHYLAFTQVSEGCRLARLIGVPQAEIIERLHPELDHEGSADLVEYYGIPMRRRFLDSRFRRYSPASLRKASYHRENWDVRVLPFCPESFEVLRSGCPNPRCGTRLNWRGGSINKCASCGEDLRTASADVVEMDRDIATWVASLVSTNAIERTDAWAKIPGALAKLGTVAVLDLLVIFGALSVDPTEKLSRPVLQRIRSGDFAGWTMPMLLAGGKILRDWPDGFFQLVRDLVEAADVRDRSKGRFYLLGMLSQLVDPKDDNKAFANIFRPLVEEGIARAEIARSVSGDQVNEAALVITANEIESRFGISRPTITRWAEKLGMFAGRELSRGRRVGLDRVRFEALMSLREKVKDHAETCHEISLRTRIPEPTIATLVAKGLLQDAGPEARLLRKNRYPVFWKNALEGAFQKCAKLNPGNSDCKDPLGTALNFAGYFDDGWAEALEAVLNGTLPFKLTRDLSVRFAYRLLVNGAQLRNTLRLEAEKRPDQVPMALAACILQVEYSTLHDARIAGLLAGSDGGKRGFTTVSAMDDLRRNTRPHVNWPQSRHCRLWRRRPRCITVEFNLHFGADRQLIYKRGPALAALQKGKVRQRGG